MILTIGMPVFNDVQYIEKSLYSILSQTFSDFKLIISDDGSTDGSRQICEKYAQQDTRITYIRQPINLGISKNMQYLLSLAESEYFMWAGDDDIYESTFIEKLIEALENSKSISAFCNFAIIDEQERVIELYNQFNYAEPNRKQRLIKFIKNAHDAFGYGLFRTAAIKEVEFPVWWWPNKKSPYNNIYPTLCFYLAKGNYIHVEGNPLFSKRVKTGKNVHHPLTGESNAIKESLAFWMRRLNLVIYSANMVNKGSHLGVMLKIFPFLFYYWFIIPSLGQFKLAFVSFLNNRLKIII